MAERAVFWLYSAITTSFVATVAIEQWFAPAVLHREDGIIESVGAALYLLSAIIFAACFVYSKSQPFNFAGLRSDRCPAYAVFALAFFFAAGEEISWGQRLIGWETPPGLRAINLQQEFNVHNIAGLHGKLEHLFNLFCVATMLIIPVLCRLSASIAGLCTRLAIPLAAPSLGVLLVLNTLIAMAIYSNTTLFQAPTRHAIAELRETHIALVFAFFAIVQWSRRNKAPVDDIRAASRV